jgi:hypothetical protein
MPGGRRLACAGASLLLLAAAFSAACTTVDPGQNFVVPNVSFDPNYFYCHVEPQFIFAPMYSCGTGQSTDPPNGCHFNPSAVSGMALINHPLVDCGGGDIPVNQSQIGTGSAAASNYESVSIEMNVDWMNAPVFVRPTGHTHPRQIFPETDMNVTMILSTWASK